MKSLITVRCASALIFALALILFGISQVITVIPKRVPVFNEDDRRIGEAVIPYEYDQNGFFLLAIATVAGLQFWSLLRIEKCLRASGSASKEGTGQPNKTEMPTE